MFEKLINEIKGLSTIDFKDATEKIRKYLKQNYDYDVSDDELIYLSVHIHRVLMSHKK